MMRGPSGKRGFFFIIKARTYMYYTSNERDYSSLSIGGYNFENTYVGRKWYLKRYLPNIYVEGTMSQIFVSGLSFHFMSKNRQLHDFFFDFLFSKYFNFLSRIRHLTLLHNIMSTEP